MARSKPQPPVIAESSADPADASTGGVEEIQAVSMALVEMDRVSKGLATLRERYGGVIYPVATTQGMKDARKARADVREIRLQLEEVRIGAKRKLLKAGKDLDGAAAKITEELEAIEEPIGAQISAREKQLEAEREAREEAERVRVARILERLNGIRDQPVQARAIKNTAADIEAILESLRDTVIGPEFMEFSGTAADELAKSIQAVTALLEDQRAREAETARLKAEREELDRRQAVQSAREQAERDEIARLRAEEEARATTERKRIAEENRIAYEAQAKVDAEARQRRDAELAEQNRVLRERQEAVDRHEAEAKKRRDGEVAAATEILRRQREDNDRAAQVERERQQRAEMAMQEIQSMHHQLVIAETGRAPYCKGGDVASVDWLLGETEKWPVSEDHFGGLTAIAQQTKESVLAGLKQKRAEFAAAEAEAARVAEAAKAAVVTGPVERGTWRAGASSYAVVGDTLAADAVRGSDCTDVYGGYLIAESVAPSNVPFIAAAPDMFRCLQIIKRANKDRVKENIVGLPGHALDLLDEVVAKADAVTV